jgi:hypothetical protein
MHKTQKRREPMGTIAMLWNQKTGKFEGVAVTGKSPGEVLDGLKKDFGAQVPPGVPAHELPPALSDYHWIQHEHVEFYHKENKSICSIHLMCVNYTWC